MPQEGATVHVSLKERETIIVHTLMTNAASGRIDAQGALQIGRSGCPASSSILMMPAP